jgi:hypothetical protein
VSQPIKPREALEALWNFAPMYAKAKGERVYLEEFRKTMKAQLMKEREGTPIAAQEREAYADPRYIAHLKGLQAAVEAEETLRWRLVAAQAAVEVWRSQEASNRTMDRSAA